MLAILGEAAAHEANENYQADGDFSIQVIEKALQEKFQLECVPIKSPTFKNVVKDYGTQDGYICNSDDHWLAIRKVQGQWYNLNSTNITPPGPQMVSDFMLSLFIENIQESGYTVYTVWPKDVKQGETLVLPELEQPKELKEGQ